MISKNKIVLSLVTLLIIRLLTFNNKILQYAKIYTKEGINSRNKGELLEASQYFNRALYHNPDYAEALYELSAIEPYKIKRDYLINRMLRSDKVYSSFSYPLFQQGMHYFRQEDFKKAMPFLLKAVDNNRELILPNYYLGLCGYKLGNQEIVQSVLRNLAEISNHRSNQNYFEYVQTEWLQKLESEVQYK